MSYIVLDLEFNQAFDFETGEKIKPDPRCRFEIIQIGAVKLDNKLNTVGNFNELICPSIYPQVHPYVEKITGITLDDLKKTDDFPTVFKKFYEFIQNNGEGNIFCVWGNSDIRALYRNISYYNLLNEPTIIKYIDVQKLATTKLKFNKGTVIGLKNAVEAFEIKYDENFHNAFYDAFYTSEIFKKIYTKKTQIKIFNSAHINKK